MNNSTYSESLLLFGFLEHFCCYASFSHKLHYLISCNSPSYLFHKIFNNMKWSCSVVCLTLCDPMDCSPPGSSIHGILQARILEWVAIFLVQGIFPTQGSNPSLPHCRQMLCWLSYQGSSNNIVQEHSSSYSYIFFVNLTVNLDPTSA